MFFDTFLKDLKKGNFCDSLDTQAEIQIGIEIRKCN